MSNLSETMDRQPIDREGTFKAKAYSWSVYEAKSGAVGINVEFEPSAEWSGQEWVSWADYAPHTVRGAFFVVGKDGSVNETAVKQMKNLGWDGSFLQVVGTPPDIEVQIVVQNQIYNGADQFKVAWVNPVESVPGAAPNAANMDDIKRLDSRFGSLLRAAATAK